MPTVALTEASCQVWTYNKRAAFVLSVTEKGRPVMDHIKLQRLHQILFNLVDNHDDGIINIKHVSCQARVEGSLAGTRCACSVPLEPPPSRSRLLAQHVQGSQDTAV